MRKEHEDHYNNIKILPEMFPDILQKYGFRLVTQLELPASEGSMDPFARPLQIYQVHK